ncbi:MAG: hypothetical protein AAGI37_03925 [Planctomycetota bacterium]
MATKIKSKAGLNKMFKGCSEEVREYFKHVPKLLDAFPMQVCLAYVFSRMELGQNMALYCGVVKIHKAKATVASNVVSTQHMTRAKFVELYSTVFDVDLPKTAHDDLKSAERIRDQIMHGKKTKDDKVRNAIARVLEYAEEVNKQLHAKYRLKPFGKLQGFSGRAEKLDARTTKFLLKGMGFAID